MTSGHRTTAGVAFGAAAGALWGLVFLAPALVADFGALQLTAGRYLAYGVLAAILVAPRWRRLAGVLDRRDWTTLAVLALLGNVLYYVLLAKAVQLGGIAMTSLVIGFLPVAVAVVGRRDHDAAPFSQLAPSLVLSVAGGLVVAAETLGRAPVGGTAVQAAGLLCAVGALASWTAFAVGNTRALARLDRISAQDWSLLLGVVTGLQGAVLVPVALTLEPTDQGLAAWTRFAAVSIGVGLLASVVGNAFWNRMSRLLPLTMVGQMILFETLFALLYGFLWEQRLPTPLEWLAIALVLGSVLSGAWAHRASRQAPASA